MPKWTKILCDFFSDGTKVLGILSALASVLFLVGKAREWPVMNELKELSYAWALAPLLVLTVVAYVRRWRHSKSTEKNRDTRAAVDTLSDMLNDGSKRLFDANIANDDEHFRWNLDLASWQRQVEDHLESFFSRAEKNGFANLVLVNDQQIVGSYNPTHNWQRCRLANQLTKIRAIMIRYSAVGQ